ncbi:MAG: fumarate hydratase C-terminal domain-containing protein [Spirochaetaceae bacterium]|jgi:fumarate hydratase subunit beta|nr:fumarate hydratase C-terminal domain-containing protein [Spirochaetaceae bacterium]
METRTVTPLTAPFTRQTAERLRAGDIVELSGALYTARDAAHKRIEQALSEGKPPPLDFTRRIIFYAGPCPAPPGRVIGPIAATTSIRMDGFLEMMFRLGIAATVGKGERTAEAALLCKKYGGLYFLSTGGAAALISSLVTSCEEAAYADLGAESIKKLEVQKIRLIVGIDTDGRVFQPEQIARYRQRPAI